MNDTTNRLKSQTKSFSIYRHIEDRELLVLVRASYELNESNMEKVAADLQTIDTALGVLKNRSLIHSRQRKSKKNRWSSNRNFHDILANIISQNMSIDM